MPYYPSLDEIRERLRAATATIGERYRKGVEASKWRDPTLAKKQNFYTAMQQVIANDLYGKGVEKTPDETWKTGATTKGAPILGQRLAAALPKWEAAWGPKYEAVKRTAQSLPPSTPDYMTNIQQRLVPIVEAWKGIRRPT